MHRSDHRTASLAAALAAFLALLIAYGSERMLGLVPCALCLLERWPWRIALVLGLIAAILPRLQGRLVLGVLGLTLLASAALAFVHVGVESHFWPSPLPECAAPHLSGHTVAQLLASMPARPSKPCDAPTFLIPGLPLSMAAMNLLYSLVFLGLLVGWFLQSRRGAR